MASDVKQIQYQDTFGNMLKGVLPAAGGAIGTMFGGPAGGIAGSAIGGEVAKGVGGGGVDNVSSPVSRRMEEISKDPSSVLKQGKAALSSMDEQSRQALGPVLDEAIKKSVSDKTKSLGG